MIWSEKMVPFTRSLTPTMQTAIPWALHELSAAAEDTFGTSVEAVLPSAEEVAAAASAEHEHQLTLAFDAGHRAGRADADALAEERMSTAVQALTAAASGVAENEARYLGALEDNLALLAVCVARQIIAREVRTAPDITIDLIRRAVAEFPVEEVLRIRVNPFDLSALAVAREGTAVKIAPGREIAWVPDTRVAAGGCVIEGRERIVDGRVDTAIERAYRRLTNMVA